MSVLELSLGACVESFAALVHMTKSVKLFDFALDCSTVFVAPMYPRLSELAARIASRPGVSNVHNNLRKEMAHDLLMGRVSWIERSVSGSKSLGCFVVTEETSTSMISSSWPASVPEVPRIPMVVLGCCQGSQSSTTVICDPFSMALEIALSECNIRHAAVHHRGTNSPGFQTPAVRLDGNQWYFGFAPVWAALRERYPAHTSTMCPQLAHAPTFKFSTTTDMAKIQDPKVRGEFESTREILLRYLFAENRSGLRLSLRSLWGAYEHVLSSQGGMGKSFLSGGDGEYGPGVLDLVLFSVLLVLRPTARKLVPQEPDRKSVV